MYLFGGWDYEAILAMVDELVYKRKYGSFYDIISNLTVRELIEIFNVIKNKENKENLESTMSNQNSTDIPTESISQEIFDFLMET